MCIHHSGVCLVKYKNCDCLAAGLSSAAFDMIDIQILLIYNIFRNAKYYNKMNGGVRQFGARYITGGNPVW